VNLKQQRSKVGCLNQFRFSSVWAELGSRGPRQGPQSNGSNVELDAGSEHRSRGSNEYQPRLEQLEQCERCEEHACWQWFGTTAKWMTDAPSEASAASLLSVFLAVLGPTEPE
jgi:hypothetical protein